MEEEIIKFPLFPFRYFYLLLCWHSNHPSDLNRIIVTQEGIITIHLCSSWCDGCLLVDGVGILRDTKRSNPTDNTNQNIL